MFIGEAPGNGEDEKGVPFAGSAGRLLDTIFREVGIDRKELAMAHIVSCRPKDNRLPTKGEVDACYEYLYAEIKSVQPKLIVLLGSGPLKKFLPGVGGVTKIRGNWYFSEEFNCKILPTLHPAYILRTAAERPKLVKDMQKVSDFLSGDVQEKPKKKTTYRVVETKNQFDWVIEQLHKHDVWSADTETTGYSFRKDAIFILTFSWKECTAVLFDLRKSFFTENSDYVWQKLKAAFENGSKKVFHNGSFDIKFLRTAGIFVNNYYADTVLMHYLLNENERHGLEVLAWELTDLGGYELPVQQFISQNKSRLIQERKEEELDEDSESVEEIDDMSYAQIPEELLYPYSLTDADVTFRSYQALLPRIKEEGLEFLFSEIVMPVQSVLIDTEYSGVAIDKEHLERTSKAYEEEITRQLNIALSTKEVQSYIKDKEFEKEQKLCEKFRQSIPLQRRYKTTENYIESIFEEKRRFVFNARSGKQLRELLIDRLKLPVIKYTQKNGQDTANPSMDKEVLEIYGKTNEFCLALSKYRSLKQLKKTFLEGVGSRLDETNHVHTDYFLFSTVTGRPSSRGPNLNNIPKTRTAADIKNMFVAEEGCWLVEGDMGQAEFRVWIELSRDPQALEDLRLGYDIHKINGKASLGVKIPTGNLSREKYEEIISGVDKATRDRAKNVTFGVMYGRGVDSVAEEYDLPKKVAQGILDSFFGRYPFAKRYMDRVVVEARRNGFVTNLFGRRRRLADINSRDTMRRAEAERHAKNAPIQGAASDMTLYSAVRIKRRIEELGYASRLVLTVYDSLIYSVPDSELEVASKLIFEEMQAKPLADMVVPLVSEIKIGKRWGALTEVDFREPWETVYSKLVNV